MGETKATKNWFARRVEAEAKKDALPYSERLGNIVAVVAIILVTLYFVAHQMWSTGFFTSEFGSTEMLLFYAVPVYGIVTPVVRALFGRKNLARLFEIFESILYVVAFTWLYMVFPFDFAHIADVLPSFLRFLLQWISNDIARLLIALGIIASPIRAIYTARLYLFVRKELSKPSLKPT